MFTFRREIEAMVGIEPTQVKEFFKPVKLDSK